MAVDIEFSDLFRPELPVPAARWSGFPRYNFVGGHNDSASVPVDDMIQAVSDVLGREGHTLATYGLQSGPLGYRPLRDFVVRKLAERCGMSVSADAVLITSGSNQALELVNTVLCAPGDTVLLEEFSYGGAISRLRARGVTLAGVPIDSHGMRMDALASMLADHAARGSRVKYIYVIPTVQNPGGSVMPVERRRELLRLSAEYGVPIVEDECYADLTWDQQRPHAIASLDGAGNRVIHVGSFSKTIAPALRVGYVTAEQPVIAQMVACKSDGGTGALEQMMLAEYCNARFDTHVENLVGTLESKLDALVDALGEEFGATAEFERPTGGIFLWVTLPDVVDTRVLATEAAAAGVALNPGPEWSADPEAARSRLRLCFGHPEAAEIREGVRILADICHRTFGVPVRSGNVARG